MSIEAFRWALDVPVGGNAKVVLLGLANHAHPDGTEAYPSRATLARYAHCDPSTALRNVRKLTEEGWIARDGEGPRGEAKYRLAMGDPFSGDGGGGKLQGVASAPRGGGTSASGGVVPVPPEPSLQQPFIEPSEKERARASVEEVWEHYRQTRPNGNRCKFGPEERKLIRNALAVADLEECKLAITGLFKSEYHVSGGYTNLRYALRGGGQSPSVRATIDRNVAMARNGSQSAAASATVGHGRDRPKTSYNHLVQWDDEPA